jgi:hypothetical protein
MARELQERLEAAEKARGVQVSELRSDSHNLLQRFALEHRDMGQALRDGLASETSARVAAVRQGSRARQATQYQLRYRLRADAQNLRMGLRIAGNERRHATQHTLDALRTDIRQACRIWQTRSPWWEELKKKEPPSVAEVVAAAVEASVEIAAAPVPVEEPTWIIPEEEPADEVTAGEDQGVRAYPDAERVLTVIHAHPDGIRLVEIGNELGVDWRGLIAVVRSLMDEGKVEKIDNTYYPA